MLIPITSLTLNGITSLGQDFKTGARTASTFAILVSIITYVYYSQIDPEFFELKKAIGFRHYALG